MDRLTDNIGLKACDSCEKCEHLCDAAEKAIEKLKDCEDKEENGLLVRLPCRVGETIWVIGVMGNPQAEPFEVICMTYRIDKQEDNGVYVYAVGNGRISFFLDDELGKTVFLTQEEAEAKLKEMEGENEKM